MSVRYPINIALLAVLCWQPMLSYAIVTSDGPGTHIFSPNDAPYGFTLNGVAEVDIFNNVGIKIGDGTGVLLENSPFVLTAAHLFDEGWNDPYILGDTLVRFPVNFPSGGLVDDTIQHPHYRDIGSPSTPQNPSGSYRGI